MATTAAQDKLRKPLAIEVTDPRGNVVICAQSVWDGHIVRDHAEMTGRLDDVKAALVSPDGIRESTVRPEAQVYEWVAADSTQVRVAVTFDEVAYAGVGGTIGKVNTAFPVDPLEFDKPNVGNYLFGRQAASKEKKEG